MTSRAQRPSTSRRETGEPYDEDDLYIIAVHKLSADDIKEITYFAKISPPDPLNNAVGQQRMGHTLKREEKIAELLVYPTSRRLILDYLIDYATVQSENLSDYVLQFFENGEKVRGDDTDIENLAKIAGVIYYAPGSPDPSSEVTISKKLYVMKNIGSLSLELLEDALYTGGSTERDSPDPRREKAVDNLLDLVSKASTSDILQITKRFGELAKESGK